MGFQGSLQSVNLGDIFQTIAMNRQTGTLSVRHPHGGRHIWFHAGEVSLCDQESIDDRPGLITILMRRGLLSKQHANDLAKRARTGAQPLRELIVASGHVTEQDLDIQITAIIEEVICDFFEWTQGEFTFTDGDPIADLQNPHIAELGAIRMQVAGVIMEATRRTDEWQRIREVITNDTDLFVVDNEGRANLSNIESDPDILKVLRYLDGRHALADIAHAISLSRFDVFAITSQLVLQGIARIRGGQEIVSDALQARSEGHIDQARILLENASQRSQLPEIIRPLAEIYVEIEDIPKAVELYLGLIQNEQDDGDIERALSDLDIVITLSPDDPELHIDRAELLFEIGETNDASSAYLKAADLYINTRNTEEALTACHRAKDLNHLSATPHRYLAKAYIIEGQLDSALVEYKSLWHILLSSMRPRKALEELTQILEQDCRVSSLADKVLGHAKGSDAVKTGNTLRMLAQLTMIALLGVGCWQGYELYQKTVVLTSLQEDVRILQKSFDSDKEHADYGLILDKLSDINTADNALNQDISNTINKIKNFQNSEAAQLVSAIPVAIENRHFDEAAATLRTLNSERFNKTQSHTDHYTQLKEAISIGKTQALIRDPRLAAEKLWAEKDWVNAIAQLTTISEQKNLPARVHDDLKKQLLGWNKFNSQSQSLYERARFFEKNKSMAAALAAYKQAVHGQGVEYQGKAQQKIEETEAAFGRDISNAIDRAVASQLHTEVISLVNKLKTLATDSRSHVPRAILAAQLLPLTLHVDHHNTIINITHNGKKTPYVAPRQTRGAWICTVPFPADGQIEIHASRRGFSDLTRIHKINENDIDGLLSQHITLTRGTLWVAELGGKPIFTPQMSNKRILVATTENTLCLVNSTGQSNTIHIGRDVNDFSGQPFVFKDIAYVILGDTIHAVDLLKRDIAWKYPNDDFSENRPGRFVKSVWVQEHELKTEHLQVFAGTAEGTLVTLEITRDRTLKPYPATKLGWAASAAPFAFSYDISEPSILYMPAGTHIVTLDASTASEVDPLSKQAVVNSRGDIVSRPVAALVEDKKAILYADRTGNVTAIDADPTAPIAEEALASWVVDAGSVFTPIIDAANHTAFVSSNDGSIYALDLTRSGKILWRYPEQNTIGTLSGAPAIGTHGIYIADSTGNLFCIDKKTGALKWKVDLMSAASTGVLCNEGRIYVGTRSKTLMCFEETE